MFAGKPITSKDGQSGFVTVADKPDVVEAQFIADPNKVTTTVKVSDLKPEQDSSVIKMTEEETKHLERYFQHSN